MPTLFMKNSPRILMLLEATRGFDRGLLSGIARYSNLHGPWTFFRKAPEYLRTNRRLGLKEVRAWKPDGVICPVTQVEGFRKLRLPMIAYDVNEYSGRVPCILSDDAAAGRIAARHLLDLGHRSFAFCGYDGIKWSPDRCKAFCELVSTKGSTVEVFRSSSQKTVAWAKEEARLRRWLASLPKPIGIFCANDDRAAALLELCRSQGYGVPEDVSVVGVDDDEYICELQNPPLTSVAMASAQAGYDAAELLDQMIHGKQRMSGQRIVASAVGVTARQSTDVLMVNNGDVRKALRFIRENVSQSIQVADVVKATNVSHRTLNEQFQGELGCSIKKQLTQERIGFMSRLLTDTEMPIHKVATMAGYQDDCHFARYFKRATGLTPLAYRRKHCPP